MKPIKDKDSEINNEKKTTCAGKWSVALAIIPLGGVVLFLLPIFLGDHSGEAGLGALMAIGAILFFGANINIVTGFLGASLGVFAMRKTHWRQGTPGFILNISVLILAGAFLATLYHHIYADQDRLPIAAFHGKKKMVEKFLDRGFDINWKHGKDTALSNAAQRGHEEIVKFLLAQGADINICNPLNRAVGVYNKTSVGIVQLLLEHGANPNCLHNAVSHNSKEIVQLLLEHGADVNKKDGNKRTPIHLAIARGNEGIVRLLINNGADVGAKNNRGETPLHVLVERRGSKDYRKRMIVLLLNAGADIEAKTREHGRTPLYIAAGALRLDLVKFLLEHGANPANIEDLHVQFIVASISLDKTELTKWLQINAPDINAKNGNGESLLHVAVKSRKKDLVEILLEMGIDVNAKSKVGDTALHLAMKSSIPEIVDLLVSYGANINVQNNKGKTPLHILSKPVSIGKEKSLATSKSKRIKTFEILLNNGAKVDIADHDGLTPLGRQMRWLPKKKEGLEYRDEVIQLMQNYPKK